MICFCSGGVTSPRDPLLTSEKKKGICLRWPAIAFVKQAVIISALTGRASSRGMTRRSALMISQSSYRRVAVGQRKNHAYCYA